MTARFDVVTQPTREPMTLQTVKDHCRVDSADDDAWLLSAIIAARIDAEGAMNRTLVSTSIDYFLDHFPARSSTPRDGIG